MTFLILKISAYLLVALGIGGAAGWLARNMSAQREVESMSKVMNDARAKIPQLESLVRGRDKELKKLQDLQAAGQEEMHSAMEHAQSYERMILEKDVEIKSLNAKLSQTGSANSGATETLSDVDDLLLAADALPDETMDYASVNTESQDAPQTEAAAAEAAAAESASNQQVVRNLLGSIVPVNEEAAAQLSEQNSLIESLRDQVEQLKVELSDAQYQVDAASQSGGLTEEVNELTARLRQKAQEYDRLNREFESEKRKVAELERERDLQNKSLQVLHQQLELERSGRSDEAVDSDVETTLES